MPAPPVLVTNPCAGRGRRARSRRTRVCITSHARCANAQTERADGHGACEIETGVLAAPVLNCNSIDDPLCIQTCCSIGRIRRSPTRNTCRPIPTRMTTIRSIRPSRTVIRKAIRRRPILRCMHGLHRAAAAAADLPPPHAFAAARSRTFAAMAALIASERDGQEAIEQPSSDAGANGERSTQWLLRAGRFRDARSSVRRRPLSSGGFATAAALRSVAATARTPTACTAAATRRRCAATAQPHAPAHAWRRTRPNPPVAGAARDAPAARPWRKR